MIMRLLKREYPRHGPYEVRRVVGEWENVFKFHEWVEKQSHCEVLVDNEVYVDVEAWVRDAERTLEEDAEAMEPEVAHDALKLKHSGIRQLIYSLV